MAQNPDHEHRWGVILAGGEGARLRPLTRLVCGDDRPKQFCPLWGDGTLLGRTRLRIEKDIPASRMLFVLTRSHEPFYRAELADVASTRMVVQPCNRGTLPATLWSLMRIVRFDPRAVVTFFPSDHYYSDERNFMAGVMMACDAAEAGSPFIILLGVPAGHAETGFGWIEAEAATSGTRVTPLLRVKRFWEKPSTPFAARLLERGCVWNTFVMVGRAQAFLEMIACAAPDLHRSFEAIELETEDEAIEALYQTISATDLSAQVLSASAERLAVLCLGDVGWSDLGDPQRVIDTLSRNGLENPRLTLWRRQVSSQPSVMRAISGERA